MNSSASKTESLLKQNTREEILCQKIQHALMASGYMHLRDVDVSIQNGCITLKGHVPTYYLKLLAHNYAIKYQSENLIQNDIEVISTDLLPDEFHHSF